MSAETLQSGLSVDHNPVIGEQTSLSTPTQLIGYINAGGRGTRLSSLFTPDEKIGVSKALLPIGDPPITLIEHQVNKLQESGINTIVVGVGDHANTAEYVLDTYGDNGLVHAIGYATQLGTGGDLVRAVREYPSLFSDDVYVTNCDVLLEIDEIDFWSLHTTKDASVSLAVTTLNGVPHQNAYYIAANGQVLRTDETEHNPLTAEEARKLAAYQASSAGAMIVKASLLRDFSWQETDGQLSLYSGIAAAAISAKSMYAYNNGERLFTDIGTVSSWTAMQNNFDSIKKFVKYRPIRLEHHE